MLTKRHNKEQKQFINWENTAVTCISGKRLVP